MKPIETIINTPLGDIINISQDNKGDKLKLPKINKPQGVPINKN